jgi:hypothetical protein
VAAALCGVLGGVLGCGSNSAPKNVQVGAISFTDSGGTAQPAIKLLSIGESTNLSVNLTGDPQNLGAIWSVYCGSAPPPGTPLPPGQTQDQSCGTFSPVHTASGPIPSYSTSPAGYVTLFTAPPAIPKSGTVTLSASSTSNPSRSATVTLTIIGQYITVQFAPPPPDTLPAGAGAQFTAVVSNDVSNAGVKWTAICGSSDCGSFSQANTASGVAAAYTAPATPPTGAVQITATSVADPTRAVSSTITIAAATGSAVSRAISGVVQSGPVAVRGADVTLYAAATSKTAEGVESAPDAGAELNAGADLSDDDGQFTIPRSYSCPTPDTQMYLIADGGDAGGGINPALTLMAALGPCAKLGSSPVVINEATTTAAVYALSGFMIDAAHVGSTRSRSSDVSAPFTTARDLVDVTTGVIRARTATGIGMVPRETIATLANLLRACARTSGPSSGDGRACGQLFEATNPGMTPVTEPKNTLQALLQLAQNATGFRGHPHAFAALYQLAASVDTFSPALLSEPSDWGLAVQFPAHSGSRSSFVDGAGNLWIPGQDGAMTELIGGAAWAAPIPAPMPGAVQPPIEARGAGEPALHSPSLGYPGW